MPDEFDMPEPVTFERGWLQRQVARSVADLDELPPRIRASLYQPSSSQRPPRRRDREEPRTDA